MAVLDTDFGCGDLAIEFYDSYTKSSLDPNYFEI